MKKIMFIMMLIILSLNVMGVTEDHDVNHDYYMEVNISELVSVTNYPGTEQQMNLFIEGNFSQFTNIDNRTYTIYVSNDKEENLHYTIDIFDVGVNKKEFINGDGSRESQLIIDDTDLYGIEYEHLLVNHTNGTIESDQLCAYVKLITGSPKVKMFVYLYRDNGSVNYAYGDEHTLTNTNYEYVCTEAQITFDQNYTSPFRKYFGLKCSNCDSNIKFNMGTDTDGVINYTSFTQTNFTSAKTNYTYNLMGSGILVESEIFDTHSGIFRFRIPFYLNVSIIDNYNTSFTPIFNYIYLKNSSSQSSTKYADIGSTLSKVLTLGLYNKQSWDYELTHWTELDSESKGQIKLYEVGNYSINLLTLKTFKPDGWNWEFYKPQYTKKQIETTLDANLQITEEINQEVIIQGSEYELNKGNAIFNIIKWVIFTIIIIGGIILSFYTPNPMASIGVLIAIIMPIIYKLLF